MEKADAANRQCPEISDGDIYEAMKEIQGYLDITPADLRKSTATRSAMPRNASTARSRRRRS